MAEADDLHQPVDLVVIGSGAGGGALALGAAEAGLSVLVLEKGPRFSRDDYSHGPDGLAPGDFVPRLDGDPHTVVTRRTAQPLLTDLGWIATCVGGGTVHMGGYFYRFHAQDFRMASLFGAAAEASDDELELADWPLGYEHLEPWYGRAEGLVGVSGRGGATPFEPRRSTPYPLPPLDSHPVAKPLEAVLRSRGLHPFPTPRAVASRPYDGRPPCAYCDRCDSWGCPVGARGTSQETAIARAEATGRCRVVEGAMVREILTARTDRGPRATGCAWIGRDGRQHQVDARAVAVAASAVESARLLLLSRSARFPDGLANGNGRVGRHLQFHAVTMGGGRFDGAGETGALLAADPHPFVGRSVLDHYLLPEGVSDLAKGGVLRFDRAPQIPSEGDDDPRPSLHFEGFHDFLPNRHTWMELDPEVRDRWGLPVARIHLDLPGHHRRAGRFLAERAFEALNDLGATDLFATDVGGTSSYLVHGTCRMGDDPATSVVDATCRSHEVADLYVVDGSVMPTSGGAPPTLTIVANALRVAAAVGERSGV